MPLHAPAWLPRLLVAGVTAASVAVMTLQATTWRIDTWLYDHLLAGLHQPVDDRIVLVVVDDKSLTALGRWPWPRGVHAELLQTLTRAQPHGVAFDFMFSEPGRGDDAGDSALAHAMQQSGHVVSPVAVEASQPDGTLIEVLPMSSLIEASAALGHVEIDIQADGIAREAYLHAGLGTAHWPALALALRDLAPQARSAGELPGLRNPHAGTATSPYLWARDYRILVPYARGGGFQQVSYIDILRGDVDPALLRDRLILVGATASGVAREVLVPEHAGDNRMPGIEYHAHLLNALLQGNAIVPLALPAQLLLGLGLGLLPLLLYRSYHRVLLPSVVSAIALVATLATCILLLHVSRTWFAPMPSLLAIAALYLSWAVTRWRRSRRMASSDGLTRLANRHVFDLTLDRELASARRSNRPLSLLLADVDHFKAFNDHYGHQAGDALLRRIAETLLARARRPRDLAARYGGDELALILPETSVRAATSIAQAILEDVRKQATPHAQSPTAPQVTLSIGVATCSPGLEGLDIDLLEHADAALYRAKREGRNRIHATSVDTQPD